MIGISKLYCGTVEPSDALRYGRHSSSLPSHLLQFSKVKRPVVVWNVTRACNLKCVHCYAHATDDATSNELSTAEGRRLIDDLAEFGVPVLNAGIRRRAAYRNAALEGLSVYQMGGRGTQAVEEMEAIIEEVIGQ
jgi:hypothetical protein